MLENLSAFAVRRGVSQTTVSSWKRRGFLVMEGHLVNVEKSVAMLQRRPSNKRRDVKRGRSRGATNEALQRRELANSKLQELKFDVASGRVIPVANVVKAIGRVLSVGRNRLLAMGSQLAPRIAFATDPKEIRQLLEAELESILAEMSTVAGDLTPEAIGRRFHQ